MTLTPRDAEREACRENALRLLERRAHSVAELHRKLGLRRFATPAIEQVLQELGDSGLLGDLAYARDYVQYRIQGRQTGQQRIIAELLRRGVERNIIEQALAEATEGLEPEDQFSRALEVARNRWRTATRRGDVRSARARIYRFLLQRGFPPDVCHRVLERLPDEGTDD